ncbi:MAG: protein kinase [Planctomycetia bacterium]|nr:protein kinase [Planctomycetia bacterium]
MANPTTIDDLLALVRKSGLVNDQQLNGWLERAPLALLDEGPTSVASALIRDGLLTKFQAEQLLLGKSRGFNLGPYKILERLGTGGMALVYLCENPENRGLFALKVLPTSRAQDEEFLKRFLRESRVTAALDHPNIVKTFDVGHDGKVHFIVMEYIAGAPLHQIVHKFGPLAVERACDYVRQAALGLQHAHENGLVHRDIKPANLILDRSGTVKILDMGLARIFSDAEEVLTRGVLGTPDYVAPEQSRDSHNVDIRADIYSLGCTFYYLLGGYPPFPEGTVAQKLQWHQARQPKPLRALRPEVPEDLARLVQQLMAKEPDQRPQTPAAIAAALAPWLQAPVAPPAEVEMPQLSPAAQSACDTANDLVITPAVPAVPRRGSQAPLSQPRVKKPSGNYPVAKKVAPPPVVVETAKPKQPKVSDETAGRGWVVPVLVAAGGVGLLAALSLWLLQLAPK